MDSYVSIGDNFYEEKPDKIIFEFELKEIFDKMHKN